MSVESMYERIGRVEEKTDNHETRLQSIEGKNDVLVRLTVLMETQVEVNKEQQNQIKEQHQTLVKMNENLTGLNTGLQEVRNRVEDIENQQNAKKIDLGQLAKDFIYKIIPSLIIAYLIYIWGIN